jgi:hypothetical protein
LVPGNKKEPFGITVGESFLIAALGDPNFVRIDPGEDGEYQVFTTKVDLRARFKRGQHIGLASTARGALYATYSDQAGGGAEDRTVRPGQRYLYALSREAGAPGAWITG